MYVLVWVDEVNDSLGPQSIDSHHEIIAVNSDADELKRIAAESGDEGPLTKWSQNDDGIWFANAMYDDEVEEDQYFLIISVD